MKKAVPLPVSVPVHTPLMQQAADRLAKDLAAVTWSDLRMPLINNAEAKQIVKPPTSRHHWSASSVLGFVGRLGENHGGYGREDLH